MSELEDLRVEVARLRRATTRKVSRIKVAHGALVTGSEFDPRRATHAHGHYTRKQLESYRLSLQEFLSRGNQYVPDASARPVPRVEFTQYKAAESRYRLAAGGVYDRIKNVELHPGETIAQRLAKFSTSHRAMHNSAVNRVFDPHTRESGDIASREAMQKLTKTMKENSSPAALRRKVADARKQFAQMMDVINMPELYKATKKLTNDQFVALWNYTGFAAAVSLSYTVSQHMLSPKQESWGVGMLKDQMGDAMRDIERIKKIVT